MVLVADFLVKKDGPDLSEYQLEACAHIVMLQDQMALTRWWSSQEKDRGSQPV